jgi:ribosome-associated protein
MRHDQDNRQDRPPSKSQLKRDAHDLQQLGTRLLELPASQWQALQLPEDLIAALHEAQRIQAHGAKKRQLQYIGKLMRDVDPQPLQRYFEQAGETARAQSRLHHELERWRDRLIDEGDSAIEAYLTLHPQADRQHLRQLVRQARQDRDRNRPPAASRTLFRYLHNLGGDRT